jgi:hypothetical protein
MVPSASRWREHVVPKPEDAKHRQARPSEPQPPSVTKTTDVSSTLAGSSPTAEPEAQRTYRGSEAAAGSYVDWATLLRRVFPDDALACAKWGGSLPPSSSNRGSPRSSIALGLPRAHPSSRG